MDILFKICLFIIVAFFICLSIFNKDIDDSNKNTLYLKLTQKFYKFSFEFCILAFLSIVVCAFIVFKNNFYDNLHSYNGYKITIHRDKKTFDYYSISKIAMTKDKDLFIIKYEEEKGKFKEVILNNKDINFEITEKTFRNLE